jgi:hypothetical protein
VVDASDVSGEDARPEAGRLAIPFKVAQMGDCHTRCGITLRCWALRFGRLWKVLAWRGTNCSAQPTRTLPRRPRLASCSLNLPLFSAELADNPSDRPQDLIR